MRVRVYGAQGKRIKYFQIYRWDPDQSSRPTVATYPVDMNECGPMRKQLVVCIRCGTFSHVLAAICSSFARKAIGGLLNFFFAAASRYRFDDRMAKQVLDALIKIKNELDSTLAFR
eukprot:1208248-Rhodomonas_salina.2